MRRLAVIGVIAAVLPVAACGAGSERKAGGSTAASTASQNPAPPKSSAANAKQLNACELLSTAEVAAFLKAPSVQIDSLNSGKNQNTNVDFCSWFVKAGESEGVMLKLRRAASSEETPVALIAARGDEDFPSPPQPTSIAGVGDEALYRDYADGKGGTVIVRRGPAVVTLIGSASKETLVAMAKLVVQRL